MCEVGKQWVKLDSPAAAVILQQIPKGNKGEEESWVMCSKWAYTLSFIAIQCRSRGSWYDAAVMETSLM